MLSDHIIKGIINQPHKLGNFLGYELLSSIHSKWIKDCWRRETDYCIQAHRSSYKTTSILVVGAIWWLIFNPETTILVVRKSFEEACSIVKEIKAQYESENLQYLYKEMLNIDNILGGVWRDSALTLSTKKQITKEPNISALGIGGGIVGSHFQKIFCDDITTIKDRISKAERKSTITFARELQNIKRVDGNIVTSGTPWEKSDVFSILPEPDKYPVGSIEIQGFTPEKIQELRDQLGPSLFSANYELQHISDTDRLFNEPNYAPWHEGRFKICSAFIDTSFSGSDYTAMSMIGVTIGKLIYTRGWIWPDHIIDCYDKIVKYCTEYKVGTIFIETNGDQGASKRDLSSLWPAVIGRRETQNKHIKIISHLKKNWNKLLFAEDCQPEFLNQCLEYSEDASHDDAPDSLASLCRELKIGSNRLNIMDRF